MVESDDEQGMEVLLASTPRLGLFRDWFPNSPRKDSSLDRQPNVVPVRCAKTWLLPNSEAQNDPQLSYFVVYGCEIPLGVDLPVNFMIAELGFKASKLTEGLA